MTTETTALLDVPGARLHHEVRGDGPLVVLVGAPMDARSFAPLADLLAGDHTVLTADPRGVLRSTVEDPSATSPPELRADDLARLITHLDRGPAVVVGSSGGAVTALALTQARPDLVSTVVSHEPPIEALVPDHVELRAQTDAVVERYLYGDVLGAWTLFLSDAGLSLPDGAIEQMFGGDRDAQAVSDEHHFFANELRPTTRWVPDLDTLRSGRSRVLVGVGEESSGQVCDRTSRALAQALGTEPVLFPGGHTGFADRPEAFAGRLRAVLSGVQVS